MTTSNQSPDEWFEDDYYDDAEEWQPGECDRCYGPTVDTPLGPIYCACAVGQGAGAEDCLCGPPDEECE